MKTGRQNFFKRKLKNALWRIFNYLENNGNADFYTNGENSFLKNFVESFSEKSLTVFDVGANRGEWTKMFLGRISPSLNYDFHLFEPSLPCVNELKEKFSGNRRMNVVHAGISDVAEKRDIFYDEEKSGLASLYQRNLAHYGLQLSRREQISLIRADDYIAQKGIPHIHFLKVDTEGHELSVFRGFGTYLSPDFIDVVQFEYGGANLDSRTSLLDLYELLQKKGFVLCKIMKNRIEERSYSPSMENFVYANYLALGKKYCQ